MTEVFGMKCTAASPRACPHSLNLPSANPNLKSDSVAAYVTGARDVAASVARVAKVWLTALAAIIIGFFSGLFSSRSHPQRDGATAQPGASSSGAPSVERGRTDGAATSSWGNASSSRVISRVGNLSNHAVNCMRALVIWGWPW